MGAEANSAASDFFFAGSMALTVLANVCYHVCQRGISPRVHPLVSLCISYAVGLAASAVALALSSGGARPGGAWSALGQANWASYALGLALVGLELGFLWAYRAGWPVGTAAIVSNAAVSLLLVPIGLVFFGEGLGAQRAAGILLVLGGLWLLKKG
jgi:multidrug transporter EmrE-like cation transporter